MPKKMHDALVREAKKKGYKPGTEEYDAYVYGTMAKRKKKLAEKKTHKRSKKRR